MKKAIYFIGLAFALLLAAASCQKAPFLTFNGQKCFTFKDTGGSETITFSCNRAWTAKSSESWITVSPAQGDANEEGARVTITCAANTTYDPRTATITISSEGLTETISISQDTNYGLLSNPTTFNLTNAAQTIDVEVKANVEYSVTIDDACKDWISQAGTKALSSTKLSFNIAANELYIGRKGTITIKQRDGNMSDLVLVQQAQTDFLEVTPIKDSVSCAGGTIELNVLSNVDYSISVLDNVDWVTIGAKQEKDTKDGLTAYIQSISIAESDLSTPRYAKLVVNDKSSIFTYQITIAQGPLLPIQFADSYVKQICVQKYDTNGDGELSYKEAEAVQYLENYFFGTFQEYVTSFDELQFFTNITYLSNTFKGCKRLKSVILPKNISTLYAAFSECEELEAVGYSGEHLSSIGEYTFQYCKKLKKFVIPNTVSEIGKYAFYYCESIDEIVVPEGVRRIEDATFAVCKSLYKITLPKSLEVIGSYAFRYCPFSEIIIPENVFEIQGAAFEYCSNLLNITIPASVKSLKCGIFANSGLKRIYIPETVEFFDVGVLREARDLEYIDGPYASSDHRCLVIDGVLNSMALCGLTEYTTPPEVLIIGKCMSCVHIDTLQKLIISEGVTEIQESAFYYMDIRTISFPSTLKQIGFDAFGGVISHPAVTIYCKAQTPPVINERLFYFQQVTIFVPNNSVNEYKSADKWKDYSSRIYGYDFQE